METQELSCPNLEALLQEIGEKIRNEYQDNLIKDDALASGKLLNSVEFEVSQNGRTWSVKLKLEDYWKYLEGGSKGTFYSNPKSKYKAHFPPPSKILAWIKAKPVIPKPVRGKIPTPESLAFAIAKTIYQFGTDPRPNLEKAVHEIMEVQGYAEKIPHAFLQDINYNFDEYMTNELGQWLTIVTASFNGL